uniref:Expansin n=1 Tax=Micrasterias denticulata TaxID=407018 RepID=G4V4D4_9VIRI|nr:expansin [Micrasterias denticulata]
MDTSLVAIALLCSLLGASGQVVGNVAGKPVVKKVTPIVIPPAAAKLFNRPAYGFTASYYGGQTDGGSCGYGSAQQSGYGVATASASTPLYAAGLNCGACFTMSCQGSQRCLPGNTPMLTVTNLCKAATGPCSGNKRSWSLAPDVWNGIAVNPNVGVVPVRVTRVPCQRAGGVQFKVLVGNPYYLEVLISNVAGSVDLAKVEVLVQGVGYWQPMKHDYGAVYSISGTNLANVNFSFRLTSGYYRESIVIPNAISGMYEPGVVLDTNVNFKLAAPRPVVLRGRKIMEESTNATLLISE